MRTRFLLAAAAGLSLSACATVGPPPRWASPDVYAERYNADYDATKVAAVTQWAHVHGATVLWINYPTKKPGGT